MSLGINVNILKFYKINSILCFTTWYKQFPGQKSLHWLGLVFACYSLDSNLWPAKELLILSKLPCISGLKLSKQMPNGFSFNMTVSPKTDMYFWLWNLQKYCLAVWFWILILQRIKKTTNNILILWKILFLT